MARFNATETLSEETLTASDGTDSLSEKTKSLLLLLWDIEGRRVEVEGWSHDNFSMENMQICSPDMKARTEFENSFTLRPGFIRMWRIHLDDDAVCSDTWAGELEDLKWTSPEAPVSGDLGAPEKHESLAQETLFS